MEDYWGFVVTKSLVVSRGVVVRLRRNMFMTNSSGKKAQNVT